MLREGRRIVGVGGTKESADNELRRYREQELRPRLPSGSNLEQDTALAQPPPPARDRHGRGGAGVLNTVEHSAEPLPDAVRWLLVGSLAAAVLSVALITHTLEVRRVQPAIYRIVEGALLVAALFSLCVGLTDWGAKASLTAMVVLLLAPVAMGLVVLLKQTDPSAVD